MATLLNNGTFPSIALGSRSVPQGYVHVLQPGLQYNNFLA